MVEDYKKLAATKRDAILASIPQKWRLEKIPSREEQKDVTGSYVQQFLSKKEIDITETDVVGIAKQTTSGNWSAVEVTEAFCHRASLAHQLVNCLHETFFDAALADAKQLDEYLAKNKKSIGPLHGVPISLKDQFHVKGVETTMGYIGWIGTFQGAKDDPRKGTFESEMVRELRALGAVLYCKTSVPHTLMTGETTNHIIDYTWNPKNRNLCSGGSSGGEGALIGLRGSPAGFGTDIGGSIRIPAGFNGLYGIRPSSGRMPYEGMANSMDGQNSVLSVVGPLATTAGAIKLLLKSILSQEPWLHDPLVIDMPWSEAKEEETRSIIKNEPAKFSFAILKSDGVVKPQPPVVRALKLVADALTQAGHKVIEWNPPNHKYGLGLLLNTWIYDGGKDVRDTFALSGEPPMPQVAAFYGPGGPTEEFTGSRIAANNVAMRVWKKEYMDYWNSTVSLTGTGRPVDGVVCPIAPYPAARREMYGYYGYSAFVNALDYTSMVVPVTTADATVDKAEDGYTVLGDEDKASFEAYDAEIYDGAHVSVQIVGRRLQEEKMVVLGEYIGGLVGK